MSQVPTQDGSPFEVEALWLLLAGVRPERDLPVLEDEGTDDFFLEAGWRLTAPQWKSRRPRSRFLEPAALAQQEEEYVAFLRRDAMFTGERFGKVHASDGPEAAEPLSFQVTFGQLKKLNMQVEVPKGPIDPSPLDRKRCLGRHED